MLLSGHFGVRLQSLYNYTDTRQPGVICHSVIYPMLLHRLIFLGDHPCPFSASADDQITVSLYISYGSVEYICCVDNPFIQESVHNIIETITIVWNKSAWWWPFTEYLNIENIGHPYWGRGVP